MKLRIEESQADISKRIINMTEIKEGNAKSKRQNTEAIDSIASKKQKLAEKSDSRSNKIDEPTTKAAESESCDDSKKESNSLVKPESKDECAKSSGLVCSKETEPNCENGSKDSDETLAKKPEDTKKETEVGPVKDENAESVKNMKECSSAENESKSSSTFVFGKNSKFGATAFASLKGKQSVFGPPSNIFGNSSSVFGSKSGSSEAALSKPDTSTMMKSNTGFVFGAGSKYANAFKKSANSTKSIFDSSQDSDPNGNNGSKYNDDSSEGSKSSSSVLENKPKESSTLYQAVKLEKQVISSGEEEETSVLQMKAKLYVLENIKTGWKERGVGILHVNKKNTSKDTDKDDESSKISHARIVMRTMNVLKLVLNVSIAKPPAFEVFKGMESSLSSEKFIRFNNFELANDGKAKLVQYAVRVSTAEAAEELYNTIKSFV